MEKLDNKNKQNVNVVVNRLMDKFFKESWEYMDPGNEGFIEVSRASSFIHRIINQIKMDDEEEELLWKKN